MRLLLYKSPKKGEQPWRRAQHLPFSNHSRRYETLISSALVHGSGPPSSGVYMDLNFAIAIPDL